jgi:alpha-L-rhamnosidase
MPSPTAVLPDLSPAQWIWYPCERCLPNTFVLFRRTVEVTAPLRRATGWIAADSRYRLEVNGHRIQWGPAPSDPRWPEADPVDLTAHLQPGTNVLAVTVLYYGHGDGTWPIGKPGFLCRLELEDMAGKVQTVATDSSWLAHLCRAWAPGHYKRWYLRSLQEEFDANLYPYGWNTAAFTPDSDWRTAMNLGGSPNLPALNTPFVEYQLDIPGGGPADARLRARSIPLLREDEFVPVARLNDQRRLEWVRPVREYFECRTPDAYRTDAGGGPLAQATSWDGAPAWAFTLTPERGVLLTYELAEQVVGWPGFTIEAPAGTVVELLVHEAHRADGPPVLNTHFDAWTRFTCRAGVNHFETFDFESLRWLQLHVHGTGGPVRIGRIGVRRRVFPWPHAAEVRIGEPALQRLMDATVNTLHNCAQEALVDGMARERQQYSGDCGHQAHAIYLAFGEQRLPARFLATYSQGMTKDGFFLDCWPGFDRLARLVERQLDLTGWGPILDHGVGFNFDCWHHYLYTGDLDALREPYPRLLRFADYLPTIRDRDGLLAVENLGIPSVWIDHIAYQRQRHKQCAFNLYAAAMLEHALAPICEAMGDSTRAEAARKFGRSLRRAAVARFWDPEREVFVNNRPWLAEEGTIRCCDRSLATALLYGQCPGGRTRAALQMLADVPPEMGLSYPANAGWRLWALAQGGRTDVIAHDLRHRWATMGSVIENNTLQEDWEARHDSNQQWSHCPVVPLYIAYHGLAGIRPLTPGCGRIEIRPQPADIAELTLTAHTVRGPVRFASRGLRGDRRITLDIPAGANAELVLPRGEQVDLPRAEATAPAGLRRYQLPAGRITELRLRRV